jgi:N6-adenosine-specific RNA methylase IME4
MSWDEIIALMARVAKILLPDNWVFLWIPRAHLLALHPVEMEFADDDGRVITRTVKLPLAWAVARALGCDNYSTCYIWTKTDEDHPDDHGGGVLVFDQDEILLQFKRGRGLPKPATSEKFNSNHRERKREHSRKPDHYREMIRTMTGGVPVLELFARVDAEHPLPPDWQAWGNQAQLDPPAAPAPRSRDHRRPRCQCGCRCPMTRSICRRR